MGKVYRAEQTPLGRVCALKVLNTNYSGEGDPEFQKRFFLEASIASKLKHPNTVTVFDYGKSEDDVFFMAMELLEGKTLHKAIRESGSLSEERATHIARQICRSLREAHKMGVIHRDLKPANIFLTEHGDESDVVKVLDFGLVKNIEEKPEEQLTHTGLFMGSPKYMAPEQIQGGAVDGRTDIYALGVILYEMLTGKVPFDRATSVNTLMAHVSEPPPPLRAVKADVIVSPALEELIYRCIAKDPGLRFASMEDVLIGLKHASGLHLQQTGDYGSFQAIQAAARLGVSGSQPVPAYVTGSANASNSYPPSGAHASSPPGAHMGSRPPPSLSPHSGTHSAHSGSVPPGAGASQSATPMPLVGAELSAQLAAANAPRRNPFIIPTIAFAAIVIGGSFGFGVYRASTNKDQAAPQKNGDQVALVTNAQTTPSDTATAPPSSPTTANAAPAPPSAVKWIVTSDPEGAAVRDNGIEVCNATPCELSLLPAEAAKSHHLVFSRVGFRPEVRNAKVADGAIFVRMTKVGGGYARPSGGTNGTSHGGDPKDPGGAASPPPSAAPANTGTTPSGFKETPY
jgi:serine/threonine-protein kinase